MKAGVSALSDRKVSCEIKLCALVKLVENGEAVKMSKRAGNFIFIEDVIEKVGIDALRFIMLTRKNDIPLDFDLAKVLEQNKDNPVFYVQYAHARCYSAMRQAGNISIEGANFSLLKTDAEFALIKKLSEYPRMIEQAAISYEPHRIAFYLEQLAAEFHSLWNLGNNDKSLRFIVDDASLTKSRLALVKAVANVIASGLPDYGCICTKGDEIMDEQKDFHTEFPFHEPDDDTEIIHVAPEHHSRKSKIGRLLIIFLAAIAVVIGAKELFELGKGKLSDGEIPTIEANPEPYKAVPENPGGMQIPNIDKEIYAKLKMPIDTPINEPVQSNDALSKMVEKEQMKIAAEDSSDQAPNNSKIIHPTEHKSGPETIKLTPSGPRIIDIPQPKESSGIKKIDVEKVLANKGEVNEIWLQLGSYKSEDEATKAWQDVREKNGDIIKDLTVKVKKTDMKDQGIFYRLQVGPVADDETAKTMCARFNDRKQNCFYTSFKSSAD